MFAEFSSRALMVIYIARVISGHQGAHKVSPDHLLAAIVVEDQGTENLEELSGALPAESLTAQLIHSRDVVRHFRKPNPFLPHEVARKLLSNMKLPSLSSPSVAETEELEISNELLAIFDLALQLKRQTKEDKLEPLHILLALFKTQGDAQQTLMSVGLTEMIIREAIRKVHF